MSQSAADSPPARRANHSPGAGVGGLFVDAAPALILAGATIAGGFGPLTDAAAWALIGAAAVKIAVAQGLGRREKSDEPPGALALTVAAGLAAAFGGLALACFYTPTPDSLRLAAAIFAVGHVTLGQDRDAAASDGALPLAALALGPLAAGLCLRWESFTPVPLAALLVVAIALLLAQRARQKRSAAARETQRQFATALDSMNQSLAMFDGASRLVASNSQFHRMFRLNDASAGGSALNELLTKKLALRLKDRAIIHELVEAGAQMRRERQRSSVVADLADGRFMEFVYQPTPEGFSLLIEDITARRVSEIDIERMARQDDVTGLWNRSFFRDRLENAVARGRSDPIPFAVMVIDLDRFKQVNDSLGHPVGDKLLKRVAERLKQMAAPEDIVARLGGDEFTVLRFGDRASYAQFAAQAVENLSDPYLIDGAKLIIGASVGVAVWPDDGANADELMKTADMALYAAKDAGRGTSKFFESAMAEKARKKQQIEQDLRIGIGRNELEVYYQPIVSFSKRRICSCEALVRWRHPTLGMISPADFIPVAEESGLVVPLGEWVLRRACEDAKSWPKDVRLAVNFSALQFARGNVVEMVRRALHDTKFPPSRLEMEITESVLINEADSVLATIDELRDLGLRVALDDFGTGYSSLAYLSRFRPDKVKIDQSFVRDMEKNAASLAIIKAVKALVDELGIDMLVEGVETVEQLEILREHGADEAQGYLFSRPRPANEIARFVADPAQLVRGRNLFTETNARWTKGFERVNPAAVRRLN